MDRDVGTERDVDGGTEEEETEADVGQAADGTRTTSKLASTICRCHKTFLEEM